MCLNSGGENDNGQNFFSKIFLKGGKWQRGENDRGYYGNLKLKLVKIILIQINNKNTISFIMVLNKKMS